ncbi:hypothetical protein [Halomonas sp. THAF5a]|uniref:hypothetical protein n=1 Tax=Halomonas sp. THAF5a TaxID=2587844 RepID=UPI0015628C8B|nr:hypothetical protein [Halomonas sp. THAF5a]
MRSITDLEAGDLRQAIDAGRSSLEAIPRSKPMVASWQGPVVSIGRGKRREGEA